MTSSEVLPRKSARSFAPKGRFGGPNILPTIRRRRDGRPGPNPGLPRGGRTTPSDKAAGGLPRRSIRLRRALDRRRHPAGHRSRAFPATWLIRQPGLRKNRRTLHRGGCQAWASLPGMDFPKRCGPPCHIRITRSSRSLSLSCPGRRRCGPRSAGPAAGGERTDRPPGDACLRFPAAGASTRFKLGGSDSAAPARSCARRP